MTAEEARKLSENVNIGGYLAWFEKAIQEAAQCGETVCIVSLGAAPVIREPGNEGDNPIRAACDALRAKGFTINRPDDYRVLISWAAESDQSPEPS